MNEAHFDHQSSSSVASAKKSFALSCGVGVADLSAGLPAVG